MDVGPARRRVERGSTSGHAHVDAGEDDLAGVVGLGRRRPGGRRRCRPRQVEPSGRPSPRAWARQRMPLPLISARLPSALCSTMVRRRRRCPAHDDEAVGADPAVAVAEAPPGASEPPCRRPSGHGRGSRCRGRGAWSGARIAVAPGQAPAQPRSSCPVDPLDAGVAPEPARWRRANAGCAADGSQRGVERAAPRRGGGRGPPGSRWPGRRCATAARVERGRAPRRASPAAHGRAPGRRCARRAPRRRRRPTSGRRPGGRRRGRARTTRTAGRSRGHLERPHDPRRRLVGSMRAAPPGRPRPSRAWRRAGVGSARARPARRASPGMSRSSTTAAGTGPVPPTRSALPRARCRRGRRRRPPGTRRPCTPRSGRRGRGGGGHRGPLGRRGLGGADVHAPVHLHRVDETISTSPGCARASQGEGRLAGRGGADERQGGRPSRAGDGEGRTTGMRRRWRGGP